MHTPQNHMGKDKHLIVFPIAKGRLVNVVAFCSWPDKDGTIFEGKTVEERTQGEPLKQYDSWEDECIEKPSRWVINNLKAVPISIHDRAAPEMRLTPHLGSGAGQATEDAYILAALLAHPLTTRNNVHEALKVYEAVRLPHGYKVQRLSRLNGKIYEFTDPRFTDVDFGDAVTREGKTEVENESILKEVGHAAVKNWEWAWTTNIEDDRKQAITMFERAELAIELVRSECPY